MTDITITVFSQLATWISQVFTALDTIMLFNFSLLNIMLAFSFLDITLWFVWRVIDSPKSDN